MPCQSPGRPKVYRPPPVGGRVGDGLPTRSRAGRSAPYMRDPSGYGQIRVESTCPAVLPAAQGNEHTMAELTEREQRQIDQANSSGKTPVVFIHGLWLLPSSWDNWVVLFEENGYAGVTPSWPDDPEAVEEARANPEVFARKTLKQVADHTAKVIRQLDQEARRDGPFDGWPAHLHDRRPGALGRLGGHRTGAVPRRPAAAALDTEGDRSGAGESAQPWPRDHSHVRPVQVRMGQRARRRGGAAALRHLPRGRPRGGPGADGERKPQPLHRGQGRSQESSPGPAADHRGREGPHRPVGDRQRRLQTPEAQRVRHRHHQDPEPRALAHDRQRLARGGTDGTRFREAIRLIAPSRGRTSLRSKS